jgi:hypothetical protein
MHFQFPSARAADCYLFLFQRVMVIELMVEWEILNLKTRVRFPVALPNLLF